MEITDLINTALSFYSFGSLTSFKRLSHGFANINYQIVTTQGVYLFRIYQQLSLEEIEKEHKMLFHLKKMGFPASFPLYGKNGNCIQFVEKHYISLFNFIFGNIPSLNSTTISQIAETLARLHTIDFSTIPRKQNILSPEAVSSLIPRFSIAPHQLPEIFERFQKIWYLLEPFLRETDLPKGLIHGDLFPDNTIFNGDKLLAVIDFEQYSIDTLLFDAAMCINGFCFINNQPETGLISQFIKIYNRKRPFTVKEKELLPVYISWAALSMASWHLRYHLIFRPDIRQQKRVLELIERAEKTLPASLK